VELDPIIRLAGDRVGGVLHLQREAQPSAGSAEG